MDFYVFSPVCWDNSRNSFLYGNIWRKYGYTYKSWVDGTGIRIFTDFISFDTGIFFGYTQGKYFKK